jgi:hypothetical protein
MNFDASPPLSQPPTVNFDASPPLSQPPTGEEASNVPSLSILLQTIVLGCTFVTGHIMRRKNILILHEAGVALLLGEKTTFITKKEKLNKQMYFLINLKLSRI